MWRVGLNCVHLEPAMSTCHRCLDLFSPHKKRVFPSGFPLVFIHVGLILLGVACSGDVIGEKQSTDQLTWAVCSGELVLQITKDAETLCSYHALQIVPLIGGIRRDKASASTSPWVLVDGQKNSARFAMCLLIFWQRF